MWMRLTTCHPYPGPRAPGPAAPRCNEGLGREQIGLQCGASVLDSGAPGGKPGAGSPGSDERDLGGPQCLAGDSVISSSTPPHAASDAMLLRLSLANEEDGDEEEGEEEGEDRACPVEDERVWEFHEYKKY
ncbi:hypothetical protein NHX12_010959 [Muraenolepis orangiensis]|uniref:Uncharacterized protein n=1 Tax=Muraenolepis orangiensis TaxID=630683 RepID=A0A9Q0DFF6_9TELE|nr:hypothetical protein NHX12_010959 [Muraenolepis orangiensis]